MKIYAPVILIFLININVAYSQTIESPGKKLSLTFSLSMEGEPSYLLTFGGKTVIRRSRLGLELKDLPPLTKGFEVAKSDRSQMDETWETVWGEVRRIRNHYNELALQLRQPLLNGRTLIIRFRLFDDGLGFRYEIPEQDGLKSFIVSDERTEFNLTGDHKAFWIPGDYDTNEYSYSTTRLSQVDALAKSNSSPEISVRAPISASAVQTPLMMKTDDALYLNIHEAALVNYPAMDLLVDKETHALSTQLVPDALGNKAYLQSPCQTPWRTVIVSDLAVDILASKLILNLNEPPKSGDTS